MKQESVNVRPLAMSMQALDYQYDQTIANGPNNGDTDWKIKIQMTNVILINNSWAVMPNEDFDQIKSANT